MTDYYISNEVPILICINDSISVISNKFTNIKIGSLCNTKQLDFGASYLNYIGVFIEGVYYGAHSTKNFVTLGEFRNMRILEILN